MKTSAKEVMQTAEECLVKMTHGYFGRETASNNIPENSEPSIYILHEAVRVVAMSRECPVICSTGHLRRGARKQKCLVTFSVKSEDA